MKFTRLSKVHGGLQASKSSSKQNKSVALDARILNDVDCTKALFDPMGCKRKKILQKNLGNLKY